MRRSPLPPRRSSFQAADGLLELGLRDVHVVSIVRRKERVTLIGIRAEYVKLDRDGQSVGMKLFNIKVVRQTESESISFWRGAFRGTLGYYISGLVFGLGFIWAAFDSQKETWHDKLFDTWVVKS